jgi:peptidoglycan L-alanyl-D-glutamate endopeptidase CwlK
MPKFSENSLKLLRNAHPDLQVIMNEAIKHIDFTVICTYRNQTDQDQAYSEGRSKLKYPKSKHNNLPSNAIDIIPYFSTPPHIRWDNYEAFNPLAGYIFATADRLDIKIKWGNSWSDRPIYTKASFVDLPHWELVL